MATLDPQTFESNLDRFYSRLPTLPSNMRDALVVYGPFLMLFAGCASILTSGIVNLSWIGYTVFTAQNKIFGPSYFLFIAFNVIIGAICLMAVRPLLRRSLSGWRMVFYANVLMLLISVLTQDLGGMILYLIGFYLLFQVKPSYR